MTCPNCGAAMEEKRFDQTYGGSVTVDVCHACQGLWFDGSEMLQLSPGSTLELFRLIHAEQREAPPLAERPKCPRCGVSMASGTDMQRSTRFHYVRCRKGHGRFMPFFQFLRAKNFVRTLSEAEVVELRRHVRQVNCSNCGAGVDIERGAACPYCRTPIAIIDPGQVTATVAALQTAESRREQVDPTLPIRLMHERLKAEQAFASDDPASVLRLLDADSSSDLLRVGWRALRRVLGD